MPIKLAVTFVVSLLVLGASYAFADGMLNAADATRARGGVGNYLFWSLKDQRTEATRDSEQNELVNSESAYEEEPAFYGSDSLALRQSSAIEPTKSVTFPLNSAHLNDLEANRLDAIAAELKADPALKAEVIGFADSVGPSAQNTVLSKTRAKNVVRGLEARGVSESQLSWKARGESDPLTDNSTAEGRAQNRRVEIRYQ